MSPNFFAEVKMNESSDCYIVKKETVDWIIMFLSAMIPQPFLSYIVMKVLDEGWTIFWYTILAINVFQFILWSANTLVSTVIFKLYSKRRLVETVYADLVRLKFPTDDFFTGPADPDIYYYDVAINDLIPANIRMKAVAYYNEICSIHIGLLGKLRFKKVHGEALSKYFMEHPGITVFSYHDEGEKPCLAAD